jgi:hypothetical protein
MTTVYLHPALIDGAVYLAPLDAPAALTSVSADLVCSYAVRASVSADLSAAYAVRSQVSADLACSYAIAGPVTMTPVSASLDCAYSIRAAVSRDLVCSYQIEGVQLVDLIPAPMIYPGLARNRYYAAGSLKNFSPKRSIEREVFTVDFTGALPDGDTIVFAEWQIVAVDGTDESAATMIHGAADIDGALVSQVIGGGVGGVTYAPICIAQTSRQETLVLPDDGSGHLYVPS